MLDAYLYEGLRTPFGRHAGVIHQARQDRKAIFAIVDALPKAERQLLPDVTATVDGLQTRAENLARMLAGMGDVESGAVPRVDDKIASLKQAAIVCDV